MQPSCGWGTRRSVSALSTSPALPKHSTCGVSRGYHAGASRFNVLSGCFPGARAAPYRVPEARHIALAVKDDASVSSGGPSRKMGSLARRAISGVVLGGIALCLISIGGIPFTVMVSLAAWQCSREYVGLIRAAGLAEGMEPPTASVCHAVAVLCTGLNAWTGLTQNRTAVPFGVACFLVMALQTFSSRKPRFSQLASTAFGLLYCGAFQGGRPPSLLLCTDSVA